MLHYGGFVSLSQSVWQRYFCYVLFDSNTLTPQKYHAIFKGNMPEGTRNALHDLADGRDDAWIVSQTGLPIRAGRVKLGWTFITR